MTSHICYNILHYCTTFLYWHIVSSTVVQTFELYSHWSQLKWSPKLQ